MKKAGVAEQSTPRRNLSEQASLAEGLIDNRPSPATGGPHAAAPLERFVAARAAPYEPIDSRVTKTLEAVAQ